MRQESHSLAEYSLTRLRHSLHRLPSAPRSIAIRMPPQAPGPAWNSAPWTRSRRAGSAEHRSSTSAASIARADRTINPGGRRRVIDGGSRPDQTIAEAGVVEIIATDIHNPRGIHPGVGNRNDFLKTVGRGADGWCGEIIEFEKSRHATHVHHAQAEKAAGAVAAVLRIHRRYRPHTLIDVTRRIRRLRLRPRPRRAYIVQISPHKGGHDSRPQNR